MNTSAEASAPATVRGGSVPIDLALVHDREHRVGAGAPRPVPQRLTDRPGPRIRHDQHLLPGSDGEAAVDDGC